MKDSNIRPASLGAVAENQNISSGIMERANALRGLTSSNAQANNTDNYIILSVNKLKTFKDHPFQVRYDEEFLELLESIKIVGVLDAILVRPAEDGYYEILAGHRRTEGAKMAGLEEIPARILNVNDDVAITIMITTNLSQRKHLRHSELAKAYKMQMDALKCQGKRTDLIQAVKEVEDAMNFGTNLPEVAESPNVDFGTNLPKVDSRNIVAELNKVKARDISRYIRLNKLISPLLELVDNEVMAFNSGVTLSFLTESEQRQVFGVMEENNIKKIGVTQAEKLKAISKDKNQELNKYAILQIINDESSNVQNTYSIFQNATKKALKHFKKTDYQGIQINQDELEKILVETIKSYAENRK